MEKNFLHNFDRSVLIDFTSGNLHKFNVKNVHNVEISLDNELKVIQDHLNISTYYSDDYLNKVDKNKVKMQLWQEEHINTFKGDKEYDQQLQKVKEILIKKYKLTNNKRYIGVSLLDNHTQELEYLIQIIFSLITGIYKTDITHQRFHKELASSYIYNRIFYRSLKKGEYKDYEEYLKNNCITDNIQVKFGIQQSSAFYTLELISDECQKNDEKEGTYMKIEKKCLDLINDNIFIPYQNIPKLVEPLPWILKGHKYEGGNLRKDQYTQTFVHKSFMHGHKISNVNNYVQNINYIQNIPITINKLFYEYIFKFKNDLSDMDQRTIELAGILFDVEFYLPQYIDWRGRLYTYSVYLNYQGSTLSKCLINYNQEYIQNGIGYRALGLYAAELYGFKQKSNNEKIIWFNMIKSKIQTNNYDFIHAAQSKLEFINFSLHYQKLIKDGNHKWSIPIGFDACCSGLQHISLLLGYEDLGNEVNIIESDDSQIPKDLYTYFIPIICEGISKYCNINPEYNILKKFNITRSLLKQIIKTVPYSVTNYGVKQHLVNMSTKHRLYDPDNKKKYQYIYSFKDVEGNNFDVNSRDLKELSNIIKSEILARFGMLKCLFKYFKNKISLLIKLDLPTGWETPAGIIVEQKYLKSTKHSINVSINNKKRKIVMHNINPSIQNSIKAQNAIVPNIIHSLDANHLSNIITKFRSENKGIFTIHDCFLINPNDYDFLYNSVITEFIDIYSKENFIKKFHDKSIILIKQKYEVLTIEDNLCVKFNNRIFKIPDYNNQIHKNNNKIFNTLLKSKYLIK